MSLYTELQNTRTEEDVKKAYIKALGLKEAYLGRVDIQTDEIWFEAKDKPTSTYEMFTQLLHYVKIAQKQGDPIPPFLCVIDRKKAAIMETAKAYPILDSQDKEIKWSTKASTIDKLMVEKVSQYLGTNFVSYNIEHFETEFKNAIKIAIKEKRIVRTNITPNNLKEVFDIWCEKIGKEIKEGKEENLTLLFYADIMSDGTNPTYHDLPAYIIHAKGKPAFSLEGKVYELASVEGYREFWNIYEKPPKEEYRKELLERQDSLIPLDRRKFTGAYYTPLNTVRRAYAVLHETLGENWQKDYVVWDMCCGVGNLEVMHNNPRNIFMSTLEQEHIDIMRASKTCVGANIFQYDYLNDDIADNGKIDYTLTNKLPTELQKIIAEGKKKILVLINPPYGEAGAGIALGKQGKKNVSNTKMSGSMEGFGKSRNELFTQFVARILKEVPNCTLAMFSTLKYVNAPNFVEFRKRFLAEFLNGFITHSKAFDGLKGDFPIGFLMWNINHKTPITEILVTMVDKNDKEIGDKAFTPYNEKDFLSGWGERPKINDIKVVPLKNAVSIYTGINPLVNWSNDAIGYMVLNTNDMQHTGQNTFLLSSPYGHGHGMYINAENLAKACVMFTVRRIVKHTWVVHNDQFLIPNKDLTPEFYSDCLIWMLFNGKNLTASADGLEYGGKTWSIVNHFIPYTEAQVGASGRFESDFMVEYLKGLDLSDEAQAVYNKGLELWQDYFKNDFNHKVRSELKLNRPDVGWYQVRKALETNTENSSDFAGFKAVYENLTQKILPQVYEYGFLK